MVYGHPLHAVLCHAPTDAKVAPQAKRAEIECGDRPHDIHDPHLLGVAEWLTNFDDNKGHVVG